ncbi:MAG: hypothetical protein JNJ57_17325 [Saprospiraceae bacterium]|nr:hypothetical protein [Saprospiraceae bacterium]
MKKHIYFALFVLLVSGCAKDAAYDDGAVGKSGSITRFAVFQHYMYVLNQNEIQTYDIQDKAHPALIHRLPTDYGLETITIYEGTVFVGSTTALYLLDISTPAEPKILSKSDRVADIGFTGCDPVAVKGNYAYSTIKIIENACGFISAESALVVYDVTDKTDPNVVGTYPLSMPNGLGYQGNYLFVCDEGTDQLEVFDISDPTAVKTTSYGYAITDPFDLIVDGQRLIVSSKTDFLILDISDVAQIRKVGQITK